MSRTFFRRREISGFPRLSLNYRTAAMPCLCWFRLCVPLTAVSGRPVSQSVTNSILDGVPSVLCRFRRSVQSMPSGVPAVVSSTVCMIPYAAPFVNRYFSLFLCPLASGSDAVRFSELFGVVFSALFTLSVLFPNLNYFSASGKEKGDLLFFDMLLNF